MVNARMTCIEQTVPLYCLDSYTKRVRSRQYTEPVCSLQVIAAQLTILPPGCCRFSMRLYAMPQNSGFLVGYNLFSMIVLVGVG